MNLKYILLATVLLCRVAFLKAQSTIGFKIGEQVNVWALKGIALKQQPDRLAKNILIIPYGQSVKITGGPKSSLSGYEEIDFYGESYKLNGKWVIVSYNGRQGYVFGGYLSKMPPFKKTKQGDFESEEDYLKRNYNVRTVKKVKGKDGYEKTTTYYKNGDTSILTLYDGCFDTELYMKIITYPEAVLFMGAQFNDADAPMQDLKIKALKGMIKISYYSCD